MSHHRIYLMNKRGRYSRRYLLIICSIFFLIVLLIDVQIHRRQWNESTDDGRDRPEYCDQSILRRFYMHDRSPRELFVQDPIRSSFTYELSNNNTCSPVHPPHALIFVISKSRNSGVRSAIRRTWGNLAYLTSIKEFAHLRLKLLFLLDIDETSLFSVHLEQSIYHDLVQVHLPQHYSLSTYRDMAILHWTETYCSNALFTLKTDDDVFINTFLFANTLNQLIANATINASAVIYGVKIWHASVLRHSKDPTSEDVRYITTDDEYPCRYYPIYLSGFGYLISRTARSQLLYAFFRAEKLFHLSDVFVTGILAEYMNIHQETLRWEISSRDSDDCESFFQHDRAFACASALHYPTQPLASLRDVHILERFNAYWKHVCKNRLII